VAPSCQHHPTPLKASRHRAAIDDLLTPDLFRAFGDPTRVAIVACLIKCGRPCSVTEVAEASRVDFSVVARHLRGLASVGLTEASREGRVVRYRVRCDELCDRLRSLIAAIEEWCPNLPSKSCGASCSAATPAHARKRRATRRSP
jgi:DNA-binding transcriptional ArsR family regulator